MEGVTQVEDVLWHQAGLLNKTRRGRQDEGCGLFLVRGDEKPTAGGPLWPWMGSWIREEIALKDITGAIDEIGIWTVD